MSLLQALSLFVVPLLAIPTQDTSPLSHLQERAADFEWTAWGDSYASGVGAGKYIDGRRCLRYQEAYPVWLSDDPDNALPGKGKQGKFNNVVCSGAKAEEVEQFQLYTEDQGSGQPNWQFYPRPSSGKPTMGTLTVGGDDIDFPGILSNCIMEGFSWPISSGFTPRSCDEQRALSWSLISQNGDHDKPNAQLINKIVGVIQKIVKYGQDASGDKFKLYVTGYGQFFNDQDPGCDQATFARTAGDGKPHQKMTRELRADFNHMSRTLNGAILEAVKRTRGSNLVVKYIDIDSMLTGHRFCEPGIQEPDLNNKNLWFWHYPYDHTPNDLVADYMNRVAQDNLHSLSWDPKTTLWTDYLNSFWTKVDEQQLYKAANVSGNATAQYNFWSDYVGHRARVFHPQMAYHEAIYKAIAAQYTRDQAPPPAPGPPPASSPSPKYATGVCHLHVNEFEIGCQRDQSKNLQAEVIIQDAKGQEIGHTEMVDARNWPGINANAPLHMKSNLTSDLVVTGEHAGDYVQFTLGDLSWKSRTSKADSPDAYCDNGGWDPKDGSSCLVGGRGIVTNQNAKNQIDCWFKC